MKEALIETPVDKKVVGMTSSGNAKNKNFIDEELNKFRQNATGFKDELPKLAHEVIDKLYIENIQKVDKNLNQLYEFMKPLSHSIYYDRKVEYLNLIEEFEKSERQKLEYFLKQTRFKSDSNFKSEYKQKQEELINLMNVYDIKHPLRGPKYEKFKALEEVFKDKILNLVSNQNAYLKYKQDIRQAMDQSELRSEAYQKFLEKKYDKTRTILKYRLYGVDAINEHEFKNLVEWGHIKKIDGQDKPPKRVKKTKIVYKKNKISGQMEAVTEDVSGDGDSCYEFRHVDEYELNDNGSAIEVNQGYKLGPLPAEIFGQTAARISKLKLREKRSSVFQSEEASTAKKQGNATFLNLPSVTQGNSFGQRHRSIPLNTQSTNLQSFGQIDSQMSLGIDLSFLPAQLQHQPFAKNAPVLKQQLIMPHLANKYKSQTRNFKMQNTGYDTMRFNQTSELDLQEGAPKVTFKSPRPSLNLADTQRDMMTTVQTSISKKPKMLQTLSKDFSLVQPDLRMIPGSPYRFRQQTIFNSQKERKQLGDGRINKVFKGKTSTLKDDDVKELIQKLKRGEEVEKPPAAEKDSQEETYKVDEELKQFYNPTAIALAEKNQQTKKKLIKNAIENIIHNIDRQEQTNKLVYQEMLTQMVQQNVRNEQLQQISDTLREISYADPRQMGLLFEYKKNDDDERVRIAQDVAKEYHEGKLDPHKVDFKIKKGGKK